MKKWMGLAASAFVILQVVSMGTAEASTGYDSSTDTTINVSTGSSSSGLPSLGTALFNTQEGVYQATGTSVSHDYVWVNVNGTPILAVDPPKPVITY